MCEIPENTSKNTHNVVEEILMWDDDCRVILDIPCGAGAFTKRFLDKGLEVHSADIKDIIVVKNANFKTADMNERLPYEDNKFCVIVCIDGIEHIERPFDFIRECKRILRKGGKLILSTPNVSALRSRWRWFLTGHHNKCKSPLDETNPDPRHHISMFSFPEVRYLLHSNGFEISYYTTNRVKAISYLYLPLVPFAYLVTRYVYNKEEKDTKQRKRNVQIIKQVFSKPILFGETMIVKAVCQK